MQWITTNVPFLITIIILIILMILGFKNGAIKTLGGIISAFLSSIIVILLAFLVREYFYNEKLVLLLTIVLLFMMTVAFLLFNTFFKPIKALSNTAVVKVIDKPLGLVLAVLETIAILWGVYTILTIMNGGAIETWTMRCVNNNVIMKFFYDHNLIYNLVEGIGNKLMGHQIIQKWINS